MKKYILFFVLVFASVVAKAQSGFNYYEWGAGIGGGYLRAFDDLNRQVSHPSANVFLTYNYSPYVPMTLALHIGTIEGGGRTPDLDKFGRYSKNNFKALMFHGDLEMGEIIDYDNDTFLNIIKNFYIGTGIGAISNNMADRQRVNLPAYADNGPVGDGNGFQGKDKSINLLIPFRFGYDFKLWDSYDQNSFNITLTYQHNLTFGEGLDGYNDPTVKFKNNALDQFSQINIGFKYNFGNTTSYTKLVRNFGF